MTDKKKSLIVRSLDTFFLVFLGFTLIQSLYHILHGHGYSIVKNTEVFAAVSTATFALIWIEQSGRKEKDSKRPSAF